MPPYPSHNALRELFSHLADGHIDEFFARVRPDVKWTIMGTSPMSKQYQTLQEFQEATFTVLKPIMKEPGLLIHVANVIGGGDSEWATVELFCNCEAINGKPYQMTYAWVVQFDQKGMIALVHAYLDTKLFSETLKENVDANIKSSRVSVEPHTGGGKELHSLPSYVTEDGFN